MHTIFTDDFLLENDFSRKLYHDFAKALPIIDYHNHLSSAHIDNDKNFASLTEIWLNGDHYKWRAMRTCGIPEHFISGSASDEDKFEKWAGCMPRLVRNPLFHWSHMELKNNFGIDAYLNEKNWKEIYIHCNELLAKSNLSCQSLLKTHKVQLVGTTDDPLDDLSNHLSIKNKKLATNVIPSFRPDNFLFIDNAEEYRNRIIKLEGITNIEITSLDALIEALSKRVDFFIEAGCKMADHGITTFPDKIIWAKEDDKQLLNLIKGHSNNLENLKGLTYNLLLKLFKIYNEKGLIAQLHIGALRNTNYNMLSEVGKDAGVDSIGDELQASNLAVFLDEANKNDALPRTILYNLNPSLNHVFAAMAGNFPEDGVEGKIQYGTAWWFLDQKNGIEEQLNVLSNLGVLSTFLGMTTDSRSFLSFSRHQYFRRILCNLLGSDMAKGLIPSEVNWIGKIVKDICYYNTKNYLGLSNTSI